MVAEGGGTGRTVDYHPFVGQKMKATLEGAGFEVKPLSPEVQTVTEGSNALWRWSVTAHERGDLSLILRTTVVMIDSQGKPQELRPTVEPQPIHVSIGAATIRGLESAEGHRPRHQDRCQGRRASARRQGRGPEDAGPLSATSHNSAVSPGRYT
jgi:hypothetical protein